MPTEKPIKILALFVEPTPYMIALIRHLQQSVGVDAHVFFVSENLSQPWQLSCEEIGNCNILHQDKWMALKMLWNLLVTRGGEWDVLHVDGWWPPLILASWFLSRPRKIPLCVQSDTQIPFAISPVKKAIKRLVYPWLFKVPAMMLPGGSRQAAYFRHYGVPDERITIAQMTVDVDAIMRRAKEVSREDIRKRYGIDAHAVVFAFVGRLEPHKGILTLIEAFREVANQYQQACLVVAGGGSLQTELETAAKTCGQMITTGRLGWEDAMDLYATSDIAIVPSTFEPWGLVVNEAMASGLPVIATNRVGCVDDLVLDGNTGIVVPCDDVIALSTAMKRLLRDGAARKVMSDNSLALIQKWSIQQEAKIIGKVWRSVHV